MYHNTVVSCRKLNNTPIHPSSYGYLASIWMCPAIQMSAIPILPVVSNTIVIASCCIWHLLSLTLLGKGGGGARVNIFDGF